ncbi:MAG: HNH endonuclease signature motif containing protein [Proteobacteria bacterium]|nr:HNH endonuclease signature motif containing protein [Pseudomonadota bacterium]
MLFGILFCSMALAPAEAKQPRSAAAKAEFQRLNPCPENGARRGPCPGWVIDHVKPLCAGGLDAPSNMAWQEYAASLIKDREEREQCRRLRRG